MATSDRPPDPPTCSTCGKGYLSDPCRCPPIKLTPNQSRMMDQILKGQLPTGLDPRRSLDSMFKKGLIEPTESRPFYALTRLGAKTLRQEAHAEYNGALRRAKRDLNKRLACLSGK